MNLNQQIEFMAAAANPFPLKASFNSIEGGMYACKLCGAKVKDQAAATDHLLMKHREMEAYGTSEGAQKAWDTRGRGRGLRNVLTHKGWSKNEHGAYTNETASPGSRITGKEDGSWEHRAHGVAIARGKGRDSLNSHLKEHHELMDDFGPSRLEARDFSEKRRKKLAKSGAAMPGGGFPIVNKEDLGNARQAIGRAKNPGAARAHIRERAKALGVKLPGKWNKKSEMESQTEFSPEMRLRMPKKAGQDTTTQSPQYTGGFPELRSGTDGFTKNKKPNVGQGKSGPKIGKMGKYRGTEEVEAFGFHMKRPGMHRGTGCGTHGFHRGGGYESKARHMGHIKPLECAADEPLIRQRPIKRRKGWNQSFRGYQILI